MNSAPAHSLPEQSAPSEKMEVLLFAADALARQHPEHNNQPLTVQSFDIGASEPLKVSRLKHPEYGDHLTVETPYLPQKTVHLRVEGGKDWQRTKPTPLTVDEIDSLTSQVVTASLSSFEDK